MLQCIRKVLWKILGINYYNYLKGKKIKSKAILSKEAFNEFKENVSKNKE